MKIKHISLFLITTTSISCNYLPNKVTPMLGISPLNIPSPIQTNKDDSLSIYSFWEGNFQDSLTINDTKIPLNETIVPDITSELSNYHCEVEDKTIINADENCRLTGLKEGKVKIKVISNFTQPATITKEFEVIKGYIIDRKIINKQDFKNKIIYTETTIDLGNDIPDYNIHKNKIIDENNNISDIFFLDNIPSCFEHDGKRIYEQSTNTKSFYPGTYNPDYKPENLEWIIENYDRSYYVKLNYKKNVYKGQTFISSPEWLEDNKFIILTISDNPENIYILNSENLRLSKLTKDNKDKFSFKNKIYLSIIKNNLYSTNLDNLKTYKIGQQVEITKTEVLSNNSLLFIEKQNNEYNLFSINYDGTNKSLIDNDVQTFRLSNDKNFLIYTKVIKESKNSHTIQIVKNIMTNKTSLINVDGFLEDVFFDGSKIIINNDLEHNFKIIDTKSSLIIFNIQYLRYQYLSNILWCK